VTIQIYLTRANPSVDKRHGVEKNCSRTNMVREQKAHRVFFSLFSFLRTRAVDDTSCFVIFLWRLAWSGIRFTLNSIRKSLDILCIQVYFKLDDYAGQHSRLWNFTLRNFRV